MCTTRVKAVYEIAPNELEQKAEIFRARLKRECRKDVGFIKKLVLIDEISSIVSPYTGVQLFTIHAIVETFLPCEGDILPAIVKNCFEKIGIILLANDCLEIIVPVKTLDFELTEQSFARGSLLHIVIIKTRYQRGRYVAIGEIAD